MPYTNGDGTYHDRRTCRRLHRTGNRIRRVETPITLAPCEHCVDDQHHFEDTDARLDAATVGAAIENGECPWCDSYSGDHVGQHASSAHPEAWAAWQEREQ